MPKYSAVYTIDFEPIGKRGKCQADETLADCAHSSGIGLNSICGGLGTCHSCKIQIIAGTVSEPTSSEIRYFTKHSLDEGWRLACQVHPASDCKIMVPPESLTSSQRVQLEGLTVDVLA